MISTGKSISRPSVISSEAPGLGQAFTLNGGEEEEEEESCILVPM